MFSYKTSAENTVFVFQEPVPDSTDIKNTCILINMDGLEKYDGLQLVLLEISLQETPRIIFFKGNPMRLHKDKL